MKTFFILNKQYIPNPIICIRYNVVSLSSLPTSDHLLGDIAKYPKPLSPHIYSTTTHTKLFFKTLFQYITYYIGLMLCKVYSLCVLLKVEKRTALSLSALITSTQYAVPRKSVFTTRRRNRVSTAGWNLRLVEPKVQIVFVGEQVPALGSAIACYVILCPLAFL